MTNKSFDEIPEIKTARLTLRGFQLTDVSDVYSYASDPIIAKTVSWEFHKTTEDSLNFIKFVQDNQSFEKGKLFCVWAICKHPNLNVIGSISFSQTNEGEGQIDYALDVKEWGKGIMTEAAKALTVWCFNNISDLQILKSGGLSENKPSLKIMEKCGMIFNREISIRFAKFNNEARKISEYSLMKEQFQKNYKNGFYS